MMRNRPFAYADVFRHPPLPHAAFDHHGAARDDLPPDTATVCKNESNCTVFLDRDTWFTTWSQGSFEHAPDERIVFAMSTDEGRTWTDPRTIVASTPAWRRAYGAPFVVPDTQRIYLFFHEGRQDVPRGDPAYGCGPLRFVFSDDRARTWSDPTDIVLPDRDINVFPDRFSAWLNHPPQIMPQGDVVLPLTHGQRGGLPRRAWMLTPGEASILRCDNILDESDPARLQFTLLPEGPRGIRVDAVEHHGNAALQRLIGALDGRVEDSGFSFQEMTVVGLRDGRWLGVGRTFLGSPGYTVSADRGRSWSSVEPLLDAPGGRPMAHPMTMCPIARVDDHRLILLFTNNDGTRRGARHVWDGDGRTRNPQWFVIGTELPGEARNAGLTFGAAHELAEVDDSGEVNLKTGISMPQFISHRERHFVMYNVNKEHILLDEIQNDTLKESGC